MPDFIEFYHLGKLTYTVSTVLSSLEKNPITFIFSLLLSSHDCLLSHFSSISIRYSRALLPLSFNPRGAARCSTRVTVDEWFNPLPKPDETEVLY